MYKMNGKPRFITPLYIGGDIIHLDYETVYQCKQEDIPLIAVIQEGAGFKGYLCDLIIVTGDNTCICDIRDTVRNKSVEIPEKTTLMIKHFGTEWYTVLRDMLTNPNVEYLVKYLTENYSDKFQPPHISLLFKAFRVTDPFKLHTVIIGQDPYPEKANGIAFSSSSLTASLKAMQKGLQKEYDSDAFIDPTLGNWYSNGVLLINRNMVLHNEYDWESFHKGFMMYLQKAVPHVVFVMLGKRAQELSKYVNDKQHHVIHLEHPSLAAREERAWNTNSQFKRIDKLLKKYHNTKIDWLCTQQ
jgi:uracil-DNA glycosylase